MAGYDVFARYYDALTANVDYKGRAAYLKKLLEHLHHEPGIVLDLACGTGSLTLELYKLGMDVCTAWTAPSPCCPKRRTRLTTWKLM